MEKIKENKNKTICHFRPKKWHIDLYNYIKLNKKLPKKDVCKRTLYRGVSRLKAAGIIENKGYGVTGMKAVKLTR